MSVEINDEQLARQKRIDELKVMFETGRLAVDESALASKLVDAHMREPQPSTEESALSSSNRS